MYSYPRLRKLARILILGVLLSIYCLSFSSTVSGQPLTYNLRRLFSYSRHSLHILNTTHWGNLDPDGCCAGGKMEGWWLDLVGFRRGEAFALGSIRKWRQRCWRARYWPEHKEAPFDEKDWVNVTGILSGEWVRYIEDVDVKEKSSGHWNLSTITTGLNRAFRDPKGLAMSVTGNEGGVMLRIDENVGLEMEVEAELDEEIDVGYVETRHVDRHAALVREVAATLTVYDENSSDTSWEMRVHGVHWPRAGALLLTTTSKKFAGIFGLPHLSTANDYFVTSQRLLSTSVGKTFTGRSEVGNPWAARPGAEPHCEYVAYVQLYLQGSVLPAVHEQQQPSALNVSERVRKMSCLHGVSAILEKPKLQMFAVIFSPDCGFILEPKATPVSSSHDRQHLVCKDKEGP